MHAFDTPNCGHLAEIGVNFKVHWDRIITNQSFGEFKVFRDLSSSITTFCCAPMIDLKITEAIFMNAKAVII